MIQGSPKSITCMDSMKESGFGYLRSFIECEMRSEYYYALSLVIIFVVSLILFRLKKRIHS